MSEQDEHNVQTSHMQIHDLSVKVGHLEGVVENLGVRIEGTDHKVDKTREELSSKLDKVIQSVDQRTRMPMLPVITMLIVGAGFLLTIMTLVFSSLSTQVEASTSTIAKQVTRNAEKIDDHDNGHPEYVVSLFKEKTRQLGKLIKLIDKKHAEEHIEQEEDIEILRARDEEMEVRNDHQDSNIAILQTQMAERTEFFDRYIKLKAQDRWTKTQDDDRTRTHDLLDSERHDALAGRIDDMRQLILGRKGGDFHQEDWKTQAEPRLESLERRLGRLEDNGK